MAFRTSQLIPITPSVPDSPIRRLISNSRGSGNDLRLQWRAQGAASHECTRGDDQLARQRQFFLQYPNLGWKKVTLRGALQDILEREDERLLRW